MIIKIIKDNCEENEESASSKKSFFITTLNIREIFNLLLQRKYLSFLKDIRCYICFSFPINKHFYRFSFYSKKDNQNLKLLFSPDQVVIISNTEPIVLQDKINSAYHNSLDLFFSLFIYNLSSIFSKFEFYEKMVFIILFKKYNVRFSERLLYFIDYFIIKRRLNKNRRSLKKIINSPIYNLFSSAQKNDFDSLNAKNEIVINYLSKFQKTLLLFDKYYKRKLFSAVIALFLLTLFTIGIVLLSIKYQQNIIPFLFILLFVFLSVLIWFELRNK